MLKRRTDHEPQSKEANMQVRTGVEADGCVVHIVAPDSIAITVTLSATDPTADPTTAPTGGGETDLSSS